MYCLSHVLGSRARPARINWRFHRYFVAILIRQSWLSTKHRYTVAWLAVSCAPPGSCCWHCCAITTPSVPSLDCLAYGVRWLSLRHTHAGADRRLTLCNSCPVTLHPFWESIPLHSRSPYWLSSFRSVFSANSCTCGDRKSAQFRATPKMPNIEFGIKPASVGYPHILLCAD